MRNKTTIQVSKNVRDALNSLRAYPREPLNDVLERLMNQFESEIK